MTGPNDDGLTGGRAKTRAGEANAERILDAALGVFAAHGYRGTRIDEIAEAVGMSKPNLLYYFPSKEALYTAVLTRTLDMWLEPLKEIDAAADPRQALGAYISRKLEFSRTHAEASRLFAVEIIQGAEMLGRVLRTELATIVGAKVTTLSRWIADGRLRAVDPVHFLFVVWAATQTYADFAAQIRNVTGRDLSDPGFFEEVRANLTTILLDGVLPPAD